MNQKLPFETEFLCEVYNDGSHFVGSRVYKSNVQSLKIGPKRKHEELDRYFDEIYDKGMAEGLKFNKHDHSLKTFIAECITEKLEENKEKTAERVEDSLDINAYVENKIKDKWRNRLARKRRFFRKAYLNEWNYYVTFTYDERKFDSDTFRQKLKRCFSNLAYRRDWKIMGKFEEAPETHRVHFHGVAYIPPDEMIGEIKEVRDYNTTKGNMQIAHINSFFENRFGRNDFVQITSGNNVALIEYILKYIDKDDGSMYYSRGIPSSVCVKVDIDDIVAEYDDYGYKYVFFDDVLERHKKDKTNKRVYYQEQDFIELLAS